MGKVNHFNSNGYSCLVIYSLSARLGLIKCFVCTDCDGTTMQDDHGSDVDRDYLYILWRNGVLFQRIGRRIVGYSIPPEDLHKLTKFNVRTLILYFFYFFLAKLKHAPKHPNSRTDTESSGPL